jgi:hypothetical protein
MAKHGYRALTGATLLAHLVAEHGWTTWDTEEGRGQLDGYALSWHEGAHNVVRKVL